MKKDYIFPLLMKPGKMGTLELDNRIIMAPMGSLNGGVDGYVTDRGLQFYKDIAQGGVSMMVVECTAIDDDLSIGEDNLMRMTDNSHITGHARLVSILHDYGVKAVLQLCHIGQQISLADKKDSLGPSTIIEMQGGIQPFPIRGMTKAEIKECEENFGKAAWRAKMAGYDAVEIHGAIGHLVNMFCSPAYNKRTDEYGGSPENRVRFFKEIVEACQKKCGKTYPIIVRVCGDEMDGEGGLTLKESIEQTKILESLKPAALHLVAGSNNNVRTINFQYDKRGDYIETAKAFKEAGIKLPIILDGGFSTPDLAEKALQEGACDFIGIGRPILADPCYAKKVKENRPEDITPCIRCCMGCVGTIAKFNAAVGLRCSVNPQCNMGGFRDLNPIERKKNVCVVGGGPAGMEAALTLDKRGHNVTLYEKRRLGGTMNEAAFDEKIKGDIRILIHYYEEQLRKSNVKVIEKEAGKEQILAGNYDAVVLATGAPAIDVKVKGIEKNPNVMTIFDYASRAETIELGNHVLIVGGCFMNLEMAYGLALKGKHVTISSRRGKGMMGIMELGDDNSSPGQQRLKILMDEQKDKIEWLLGKNLVEINEKGAILQEVKTKEKCQVECDNLLVCRGYHGRPKLYDEIYDEIEDVYMVGDAVLKLRCTDKRVIGNAIEDGFGVGNRI